MKYRFNEFEVDQIPFHSGVFMLGSTHYFKDIFTLEIYKNFSASCRKIIGIDYKLEKALKDCNTRPLFSPKWLFMIEFDNLKGKEYDLLSEFLKKPNKNIFILVNVKNYRNRNKLLKNKFLNKSEDFAVLDFEYPQHKYLVEHIKEVLAPKKIDKQSVEQIINRLSRNYDSYSIYLNLLSSVPDEKIDKDTVITVVDDLSTYGVDRLIHMLVALDRKTLPIRALSELLAEKTPATVYAMLKSGFRNIQQAKNYLDCGLLLPDGNINEDKKYIEVIKSKKTLINMSNKYINRYLHLARYLSSNEVIFINSLFDRYEYIPNNVKGEAVVYMIVLAILGRRDITLVRKTVRDSNGDAVLDEKGDIQVDVQEVKLTVQQKLELI